MDKSKFQEAQEIASKIEKLQAVFSVVSRHNFLKPERIAAYFRGDDSQDDCAIREQLAAVATFAMNNFLAQKIELLEKEFAEI